MIEQVTNSKNAQTAIAQSVAGSSRPNATAEEVLWIRISVFAIFFLSGAAALIYEISWTRQIGLLFGHTVHAASIVLASYFAGMSFGYWAGAKWSSRISPLLGYAIAELVVGEWEVTSTKLNTDEHPRVEFLTPISNGDGKLIRGKQLERYYNEVLLQLPSGRMGFNSKKLDQHQDNADPVSG